MNTPPPTEPGSVPTQPRSNTKLIVTILIVVGALGAIIVMSCLVSILLPALATARGAAAQVKSGQQLMTIAQGLTIVAGNNQDQFPGEEDDWQQVLLAGGLVTEDMLVSPRADPGQTSYFYVPGLRLDFDSTQVLIYENPEIWDNRGTNIAFVDGHVEWVEGEALGRVLGSITLEDGTPYRPHPEIN